MAWTPMDDEEFDKHYIEYCAKYPHRHSDLDAFMDESGCEIRGWMNLYWGQRHNTATNRFNAFEAFIGVFIDDSMKLGGRKSAWEMMARVSK